MYQCPNCGGGLRYDIASRQLACDFCNGSYDPYSIDKERDAEKSDYYQAAVFICPQCGAEILSSDETAAAFCSYCGGSTILTDNLKDEKRPDLVIPFRKTKEECEKIYKSRVRKSIFAPSEFLKPDHLDKMTGIYMPYWLYDMDLNNRITLKSTRDHREGDYIIHNHYNMTCDADLSFEGVSYDAASAFADDISEEIAPFNTADAMEFTPSFLCGFHADTQDLNSSVYKSKAEDFAKAEAVIRMEDIFEEAADKKHGDPDSVQNRVPVRNVRQRTGLFPVWFLTWRKDDRVAYAVINGENGRISLDLPVDIRKYLLFSAILTIPLYFLLESFLSMRATTGMLFVTIVAMISANIFNMMNEDIRRKENKVDDLGFQTKILEEKYLNEYSEQDADGINLAKGKNKKKAKKKKTETPEIILTDKQKKERLFMRIFSIGFFLLILFFGRAWLNDESNFNGWTIPVSLFVLQVLIISMNEDGTDRKGAPDYIQLVWDTWLLPLIAAAAIIVAYLDFHSDYWYYAFSIIMLLLTCRIFITLIRKYNILATRPMPYFNRTGGDESAPQ